MDPRYAAKKKQWAEALDRLQAESAADAANAEPGQRISRGLELSALTQQMPGAIFEKPLPPSLPALYRLRKNRP
jgi:tRNA A37 N6-isopentenylltransferase MiaA